MDSDTPPPSSSPLALSPTASTNSTTDPQSPPPPLSSLLDQTASPPAVSTASNSTAPPPPDDQSSPPPTDAASPPPPTTTTPSAPPPTTPSPPPPTSPPPPSPPSAPPPDTATSPPPPDVSPPPPIITSPPPQDSPSPPPPVVSSPPPPETISPSTPPPPAEASSPPPPPSSSPPPPPKSKTPKHSPPPPKDTASPPGNSPPPAENSPPPPASTLFSPPPPANSTSSTPPVTSPPGNSSSAATPPIAPSAVNSTEKPTARSTTNGTSSVSENTTSKSSGGLNEGGAVAIGIVVTFVVLSFLVMAVWFTKKRKRKGAKSDFDNHVPSPFASSQNSDSLFLRQNGSSFQVGSPPSGFVYSPSESGGLNQSRSWFTYEELIQATNGFSSQNLLGEGGFGCVYKGVLLDGRNVAVKQLKIGGSQGDREFRAEVEIISRIHHRHLVSLVGYCISDHQRLLVYDFVQNDTLHYHLHDHGSPVLDWATRVKVAAGAARGLAYLHEDCHPRVIHRDIKSSNILLDSNFDAQVSDFGLAKLAQELDSNTHVSTRVMGTFGYMAPEYATSGKLTEKSDVYSFGVVLLELITGRKPVDDSQPMGDESLVEWARPLLTEALESENFEELTDAKLGTNYVASEMFRMIEAAAACVRHSATKRPRMSQVARALDTLNEQSDLSNGMKPGQSGIYDSREQSAQIRLFQRLAFGSQDYSSEIYDRSQSSWTSASRDHGDRSSFIP